MCSSGAILWDDRADLVVDLLKFSCSDPFLRLFISLCWQKTCCLSFLLLFSLPHLVSWIYSVRGMLSIGSWGRGGSGSVFYESSELLDYLNPNFLELWFWKDLCVLMIVRVSCLWNYHRCVLLFQFNLFYVALCGIRLQPFIFVCFSQLA